jgi:RecJ-like exonuclease
MRATITINGVDLPAKWAICRRCEGCGTDRGASVECDGGGFTASEWAEQGEDFREGYLRGDYDKPCGVCSGSGKVRMVDRTRCTRKQLADHDSWRREEAEYQRLCDMERRMGA